jgi:hypothetical protein
MILDQYFKPLAVGDKVYRAAGGPIAYIYIAEVTRIEDGKLYLDNSKQAIVYPNRLVLK